MAARQLPPRPDLEQLKRQAKELQQSAGVPLHEAQTRLAREYGFASWNKLREEVEARTLEFAAAITEFVEAATDDRRDRAQRILALHPKILDVAVIGVPDPEMGEQVKAVVQLRDGVTPSDDLAAEIIGYVRERIARYKAPKTVDFVDELPRSATGKLVKRALVERYASARS